MSPLPWEADTTHHIASLLETRYILDTRMRLRALALLATYRVLIFQAPRFFL